MSWNFSLCSSLNSHFAAVQAKHSLFALVHLVADFSLPPLSFLSLSHACFLAGSAWHADGRRSYFNVQRGESTIQAQGAWCWWSELRTPCSPWELFKAEPEPEQRKSCGPQLRLTLKAANPVVSHLLLPASFHYLFFSISSSCCLCLLQSIIINGNSKHLSLSAYW